MHPIEILRHIARSDPGDVVVVAAEAAQALSWMADEPEEMLTAVRRLIDFHPACGPLWWVGARVLSAPDASEAAESSLGELEGDRTGVVLACALDEFGGTGESRERRGGGDLVVVASGAGGSLRTGLGRCRRPCEVRVVGELRSARRQGRTLASAAGGVVCFDEDEAPAALLGAGLLLVEALAAGYAGVVAAAGARRLAELAAAAGVPVWAVGGAGRVLPEPLFQALVARIGQEGERRRSSRPRYGWDASSWPADLEAGASNRACYEVVPAGLVSSFVGPGGVSGAWSPPVDCPVPPDLLKPAR